MTAATTTVVIRRDAKLEICLTNPPPPKIYGKVEMKRVHLIALSVVLFGLVGCGESTEDAHDRGYEEGYEDGQYEVCRELESIAPALKERLKSCRGF